MGEAFKIPYPEWIERVKSLLVSIGYDSQINLHITWKVLHDDDHSPFAAVNEMEFGGKLKWIDFRKLQIQRQNEG